jgi:hypothetical protein
MTELEYIHPSLIHSLGFQGQPVPVRPTLVLIGRI